MKRTREKGMALILTLIVLSVLSIMAVSLMFLSQSETWSTMNYRMTSQARDGAEAGLNSAVSFLRYTYTPPDTAGPDPLSNYVITGSPVTYSNNPVILSASSVSSNYPYSATQNNFNANNAGKGSITAGTTTVNYNTYATLLFMQQIIPYGSTTPQTIQTWQIVSDGTINNGVRNATVELSVILETPIVPMFNYAAFGASPTCGALDWNGSNASTGSYDSSTYPGSGTQNYDGNLGTNGNLTAGGGSTIYGSLSTPAAGVGSCNAGNVTPDTMNGGATVAQGVTALPQQINYPTPGPFTPTPTTSNLNVTQANCPEAGGSVCQFHCVSNCGGHGSPSGYYQLHPCPSTGCTTTSFGYVGDLNVGAGNVLHLGVTGATTPAVYDINSISLAGGATLIIDGPVILEITGTGQTNPVDLTGGTLTNNTYNPMNFQIQYGGTGGVKLNGGSAACGLVDAPNAAISFAGGSSWYGAVIGLTVTDGGGTNIFYDRNLQNADYMVGSTMLESFSWARF